MLNGPSQLIQYKAGSVNSFYSDHISGAQRLLNENTLIFSGGSWHLFEVTPEKVIVWEYNCPITLKSNNELSTKSTKFTKK